DTKDDNHTQTADAAVALTQPNLDSSDGRIRETDNALTTTNTTNSASSSPSLTTPPQTVTSPTDSPPPSFESFQTLSQPYPNSTSSISNNGESSLRNSIVATGDKLSTWFTSLWANSLPEDEEQSEDDADFARFRRGLMESFEKESLISDSKGTQDNLIYLMGLSYEGLKRSSHEINRSFETSSYYFSTPGTFPQLPLQQQQVVAVSQYPQEFVSDFTSRIWCTYRHSYAPIKPTNFTTDQGWGCMLRTTQSLLANALLVQNLGRDWRRVRKGENTWDVYARVLTWFIDDMSSRCPFSVHRIALLGKQLGKNIGEWFGPSTASQALKALVENFSDANMSVYVATEGVVYKNEVYKEALRNSEENFRSVLILVAIRLGISSLNPVYYEGVKACLRFPESVGIAGGKPSSSYYFIGVEGDDLFYLDPHYSRPAIELKNIEDYTEEELATFHCDTLRKIPISQLDPSMLLGFYCRTIEDFGNFCERINEIGKDQRAIFTVADEAPVYSE
ncbi:9210_t:CDS:2, partial [Paraglomus brasilianum]